MATRAHSADPRAERVRARIREAAFALAHEAPVDRLSVADLVSRAGVSRQVFYLHYTDRDDAVAAACADAFATATADIAGDARARILKLFDFAADHRAMYRNIVPSAVAARVVGAFRAELAPACDELAAAAMPAVQAIAGVSQDAVTRFLVGGFTEVLRSWMEDPDSADLGGRVRAAFDTVNALLPQPPKGPRHG